MRWGRQQLYNPPARATTIQWGREAVRWASTLQWIKEVTFFFLSSSPFHSIAQVLVHKYLLIGRPETWKAHLSRKRKTTSLGVSSQSRRWKMFNEYLISCWCSAIFSPISVFQSTEPIIWFVSVSKCIERREIPSRELIFQVHKKALIVSVVCVQLLPRITCRSGHELAIDR